MRIQQVLCRQRIESESVQHRALRLQGQEQGRDGRTLPQASLREVQIRLQKPIRQELCGVD